MSAEERNLYFFDGKFHHARDCRGCEIERLRGQIRELEQELAPGRSL